MVPFFTRLCSRRLLVPPLSSVFSVRSGEAGVCWFEFPAFLEILIFTRTKCPFGIGFLQHCAYQGCYGLDCHVILGIFLLSSYSPVDLPITEMNFDDINSAGLTFSISQSFSTCNILVCFLCRFVICACYSIPMKSSLLLNLFLSAMKCNGKS